MGLPGKHDNSQDDWMRVSNAAQHLSNIFGKAFSEADVLEEALKGRLKISVRFANPVAARLVKSVPSEEWIYQKFPLVASYRSCEVASPSEANRMTFGLNSDRGIYYHSDSTEHIKDVWDLPMIGNEKSRVENEYQQLTTKNDVTLDCNPAAFCVLVESPEGQMYVLQEIIGPTPYETPQGKGMTEEDYYPAGRLPKKNSMLVVRKSALKDLKKLMDKENGPTVGGDHEESEEHPYHAQEQFPGLPGEGAASLVGLQEYPELLNTGGDQGEKQPENQTHETDSEMVKRLKKEGLEEKQIAHKLRDAFPNIHPSRIGRLITEEPGIHVETETYRGRGRRFLKDYCPPSKSTI